MKVGTFCSGIGSPEQALKNLNIDHSIEFACEIDKHARKTYEANFKPKTFYDDLTALNYSDLPDVDLFVAGFPCQAFSIAGKRKGFADEIRGTIFFNIYEYLKIKQPDTFILENVKGLLSHDNGNTFKTIINLLAGSVNGQGLLFPHSDTLDYHIYYKVLNAKDYGIPQNRERIFIVGFKKFRSWNFPEKQKLKLRLKDLLESDVAEKYYLSERQFNSLMGGPQKSTLNQNLASSLQCPGNSCGNYRGMNMIKEPKLKKVGQFGNHNQDGAIYCASSISPTIDTNSNRRPYIKLEPIPVLTPNRKEKRQDSRRFKNEGDPSFTVTAQDRHGILYNNRIRRLTPLECFRLMGFPDSFVKPCSDTQTYKQAGNSIVVNVLQSIIKKL